MSLLTDGMISGLEDLQAHDSNILETSRTEGIELGAKLGAAEQAIQLEVAAFLLRVKPESIQTGGNGAYDLSRVAVTPALRRWHSLMTLAAVYGDAYSSQLNERYQERLRHFSSLARETAELFYELGAGIVTNPVGRAAKPTVTATGSGGASTAYTVRTAWRSTTGETGAASMPTTLDASGGQLFEVDAGPAPAGVIGFDVYVGLEGSELVRQNGTPIAPGQIWTLPPAGVVTGIPAGDGQSPDYFVKRNRIL
jgi:hypothetical protein